MYRIKLLILLLISIFFISCTKNHTNNQKYSLDYFGGGKSGLMLKNNLESKLKGYEIFDRDSNFLIKGSVSSSNDLYITNIDNTSDRELITTSINLRVVDIENDCIVFNFTDDTYTSDIALIRVENDKIKNLTYKMYINQISKIKIEPNDYFSDSDTEIEDITPFTYTKLFSS